MSDDVFDPDRILSILVELDVRFVVIGGLAGNLRGTPVVTHDLDVCYARRDDDLVRMAAALRLVQARLRVAREEDEVVFPLDERSLRLGELLHPQDGFRAVRHPRDAVGHEGVRGSRRRSYDVSLGGDTLVLVASVDDLIRMKRASARTKGIAELAHLEALREEIAELEAEGIDPQQGSDS